MYRRPSLHHVFLSALGSICFLLPQTVIASEADLDWIPGMRSVQFSATDEWLPGGEFGQIVCQDGEFTGNPFQPCPLGSAIQIRGSVGQSQVFSDDERLTGILTQTFNANFGPDFTGTAWGTWTLEVDACNGVWEGSWSGQRSLVPGQPGPLGPGIWIGDIDITAYGRGACIDRLWLKANELITTLTPFPMAYELFLPCADTQLCLPEGTFTGKILEPRWRWKYHRD